MAKKWPDGPYKIDGNLIYTPDGTERIAALFDFMALTDLFANAPGLEHFARIHVRYVAELLKKAPEKTWPPLFLWTAGGFAVVLARVYCVDKTFESLIKTFQSCEPESPFVANHAAKLIHSIAALLPE
jgi:hypothetical protein